MKCPRCGYKNIREARFCERCGTPLPQKKSKAPVIIAVVCVAVIIFAVLIGYFAYDILSDGSKAVVREEEIPGGSGEDEKAPQPEGGAEETQEDPEEETEEEEDGVWDMYNISPPSSVGAASEVVVTQAMATSVIDQEGHDNSAGMVVDGRDETSWQEGVPGDGIGEGISLYFDGEYEIRYIAFKLGNWRGDSYYTQNNRPQTLKITMDGQEKEITFDDVKQEQWVEVSGDCDASDLKIEIVSVYGGTNPDWDDTCIAEVSVYGEKE